MPVAPKVLTPGELGLGGWRSSLTQKRMTPATKGMPMSRKNGWRSAAAPAAAVGGARPGRPAAEADSGQKPKKGSVPLYDFPAAPKASPLGISEFQLFSIYHQNIKRVFILYTLCIFFRVLSPSRRYLSQPSMRPAPFTVHRFPSSAFQPLPCARLLAQQPVGEKGTGRQE